VARSNDMPKKNKERARETRGAVATADRPSANRDRRDRRKKDRKRKKKKPRFTAATADKHELYQYSVQSPEEDAKFLRRVYKSIRRKPARHMREDFCGTALLSSEWVRKGREYTAEGFDICPDTIAWGMAHNFEPLGTDASRCKLHLKDVREPSHRPPDVRCALNFSYCIFKSREEMVGYFRAARADLADDGILVLDIHGGPDAMEETEEERDIDEGFTYIWDQEAYWPATGDYRCHIHFEFKDGTRIERAFTYDWRLWTLPEIVDCLRDAGFEDEILTYWEGTAEDGESGDGIFRRKKKGENCESWIA
jgi:hypothetical protein